MPDSGRRAKRRLSNRITFSQELSGLILVGKACRFGSIKFKINHNPLPQMNDAALRQSRALS
jgi:hypothetical protein